jgi:hypothetical protein
VQSYFFSVGDHQVHIFIQKFGGKITSKNVIVPCNHGECLSNEVKPKKDTREFFVKYYTNGM